MTLRDDLVEIFKEYINVCNISISVIQDTQEEIEAELNSDTKTRWKRDDLESRTNEIKIYNDLISHLTKLLDVYRTNENLGLAS